VFHSGREFLLYGRVLRLDPVTTAIPTDWQVEVSTMAEARATAEAFAIPVKRSWRRRELLDAVKAGLAPLRAAAALPAFIASAPTLAHTLATEYLQSPAAVPTDRELEMLRGWIRAEFQRIPVMVRFEGADIPLPEMLQRWDESGVLFISVESISHPFLTDIENALFRAVHDWHHIVVDADSTLNGEILAFEHACSTAPSEIWWMLRSEIVLQAAACIATGEFQAQKLVR
jgi:hypothetical protein